MVDTFLQRVMEQRDRDQGIGADADEKRLEVLDARSRLKCSTAGCEHRLTEDAALRFDRCAVCRKKSESQAKHCGCGAVFTSIKHDKCWRCRVGLKKHRVEDEMPPRSKLDDVSDDDFRKAYTAAPSILALRAQLGGGMVQLRSRIAALGLPVRPRGGTHGNRNAVIKPKPAPPHDDIVGLLQSQLDGCDRCARLRRAIEALNG
jgi:hypothetical protein